MSHALHHYGLRIVWDGDAGGGTRRYDGYRRDYRILADGKPELAGSADPAFLGDASRHNPEELLLAAASACHMLSYLSLCAREGVCVLAYADAATTTLDTRGGTGIGALELNPQVVVSADSDAALAQELHRRAHQNCFIANACRVPVRHSAHVALAGATHGPDA